MVSLGNVSQLQCRVCALTLYRALDRLWELPLYCSGGRPGWVLLRIPPSLWVSQKLGGVFLGATPLIIIL